MLFQSPKSLMVKNCNDDKGSREIRWSQINFLEMKLKTQKAQKSNYHILRFYVILQDGYVGKQCV